MNDNITSFEVAYEPSMSMLPRKLSWAVVEEPVCQHVTVEGAFSFFIAESSICSFAIQLCFNFFTEGFALASILVTDVS